MDIVTKRDKKDLPCNQNWQNYDDWVVQSFKNETGCNNPYQFYDKRLPICNTKEEIKSAMFRQNVVEERKYIDISLNNESKNQNASLLITNYEAIVMKLKIFIFQLIYCSIQ